MQREIKKRLPIYGIAAVLLAIVLGTLCYNLGVNPLPPPPQNPTNSPLKTFSSYEELRNFLTANSGAQGQVYYYYYQGRFYYYNVPEGVFLVTSVDKAEHSTTNIQVAGVDEADIVKTDGEHIYLIANKTVFIMKAYPPEEASILSKITFNADEYPTEIFISSNGDKLAVLGTKYTSSPWLYWYFCDVKTFIKVYDVSSKTNPVQTRSFMISGGYFNSRMIGEYVYAVISQPAYVIYDTVILPKIYSENKVVDIEASRIHYSNVSDDDYAFTTVVALNLFNDGEEPNTLTVMMGGTSTMYVSLNNIYITLYEWNGQTLIYRIRTENRTLNWEAQGKVSGRELNQFSMDEFNGYFRIATTTWVNGAATTQNNLYILDMNLSIVGKLENIPLAYGEQIDSVRFIGNRCYLATSVVQRDPFFIIDVENVTEPKVLGYLKIPGFTRYLHPYDENHVIGVGRDGNNSVKISLFDVRNVSAPIEVDMYAVEGIWSSTPVLEDHKAFLFTKSKNLLAIPVEIYTKEFWQWQGVYVFNVTLEGISLSGNVTHVLNTYMQYDSSCWAQRSLYIDNVLYTVSERKVKMNDLADLSLINEVVLP